MLGSRALDMFNAQDIYLSSSANVIFESNKVIAIRPVNLTIAQVECSEREKLTYVLAPTLCGDGFTMLIPAYN